MSTQKRRAQPKISFLNHNAPLPREVANTRRTCNARKNSQTFMQSKLKNNFLLKKFN
jgi:hypothetical protein